MKTFAQRMKFAMKLKNMKQADIVEKTGISKSSISTYLSGEYEPKQNNVYKIAGALDVSVAYLMGWETLEADESVDVVISNNVKIPILGSVPAGVPIESVEDVIGYVEINSNMASKGEYFALKVKGDSMFPRIQDGDTIVVKKQPDVESGEVAVLYINDYESTVKQVKKEINGIWVIPWNTESNFKKTFYHYEGEDEVMILGKVVEVRGQI